MDFIVYDDNVRSFENVLRSDRGLEQTLAAADCCTTMVSSPVIGEPGGGRMSEWQLPPDGFARIAGRAVLLSIGAVVVRIKTQLGVSANDSAVTNGGWTGQPQRPRRLPSCSPGVGSPRKPFWPSIHCRTPDSSNCFAQRWVGRSARPQLPGPTSPPIRAQPSPNRERAKNSGASALRRRAQPGNQKTPPYIDGFYSGKATGHPEGSPLPAHRPLAQGKDCK